MLSKRHKITDIKNHDSSSEQMDNFPNLLPDTSPDFAKLKTYLVYLIIIATFSFAIAAYIKQSGNQPGQNALIKMEQISDNIFHGDAWDDKQINLFLYHWGNLGKSQRQSLKRTAWFQQFSTSLMNHITQHLKAEDANAFDHESNDDLLRTLAIVIDARHSSALLESSDSRANTAIADKRSPAPRNRDQGRIATNKPNTVNRTTHDDSDDFVAPNTPAARKIVKSEAAAATPVKQPPAPKQPPAAKAENAATVAMAKQADRSPQHTTNTPAQVQSSSVRIEPVTQTKSKNKVAKNTDNPRLNAGPTAAELDKIVSQYVDAYEKGNVKKIISLLSANARTNGESNSSEIEQNLKQVFATTKDRQLFIRNIKWKYEKNIAKGIGDIETLILPKDKSGVVATSGKIQIIAKKLHNNVVVTHLYTAEHAQ